MSVLHYRNVHILMRTAPVTPNSQVLPIAHLRAK